jgi:hypothetical protein
MTKRKKSPPKKDPNIYPRGWDRKKAEAIAAYYDSRKNEDVLDDAQIVEGPPLSGQVVWMEVPCDLVAQVQKLINRRRKSA